MDRKEISEEVSKFVMYNSAEIADLVNISPELANAFSEVLIAIDNQYGEGKFQTLPPQNAINNSSVQNATGIRRFFPGDILYDLEAFINNLTKNIYKYDIMNSDATVFNINELITLRNQKWGSLIVLNTTQYDDKTYYLTAFIDDVNLGTLDRKDEIDLDYFETWLLPADEIDNEYDRLNYKPVKYKSNTNQITYNSVKLVPGNFIFPKLKSIGFDAYFNNLPQNNIEYNGIEKKTNGDFIYSPYRKSPHEFYENMFRRSFSPFIYDLININGDLYYYICFDTDDWDNGKKYHIEAKVFDKLFIDAIYYVKSNDIFENIYSDNERFTVIQNFNYLYSSNRFEFNNLKFDNYSEYKGGRVDYEYADSLAQKYFELNITKLSENERIDKMNVLMNSYNNSLNTTSQQTPANFVPAKQEPETIQADKNEVLGDFGTSTRKAPEESALSFKIGTKLIGNDGNLWEIQKTTKTQRWFLIKTYNYTNVPDIIKKPGRLTIPLVELQPYEFNFFNGLNLFQPSDPEYQNLKEVLDIVQDYIRYSPNVIA